MSTEAEKKNRSEKVFDKLFEESSNKVCVDCPTHNPQWASVSHGTLLCIKCAGIHRGLGVHLSFVRSCTMDTWSPVQLERMKSGGNTRMKAFWSAQKFSTQLAPLERYDNDAMEKYRAQILAEAKGGPKQDIPFMGYKKKVRVPKKGYGGSGSSGHGSSGMGSSNRSGGSGGGTNRSGGFGGGGPTKQDTDDAWGDAWGSFASGVSQGASKFGTAVAKGATSAAQGASKAANYAHESASSGIRSMQDEEAFKDVGTKLKSGWSSMTGWISNTVSKIGDTTGGSGELSFYNKDAVGPVKKTSNMKAMGSQQYFQQNRKQMPSLSSATYNKDATSSSQDSAVVVTQKPTPPSVPKPAPKSSTRAHTAKSPTKPAKPRKRSDDWGFDGFGDDPKAATAKAAPEAPTDGADWGGDDDLGKIADGLDDIDLSNERPKPSNGKTAVKEDPGDNPDDWGWKD